MVSKVSKLIDFIKNFELNLLFGEGEGGQQYFFCLIQVEELEKEGRLSKIVPIWPSVMLIVQFQRKLKTAIVNNSWLHRVK